MKTFFQKLLSALWNDEQAFIRWARGFLLWAAGMGMQILAYPKEAVYQWDLYDWTFRLLVAAGLGSSGMITAGQKNLPPEKMYELVHAERQKRAAEGLEVTNPGMTLPPPTPPPAA